MRRLPLYKSSGIVLLRRELKERDKSAVIYTERFGKIKVQAKGARRIKSRFSGLIEPFSFCDFSFWWGDYTSILRECKIIRSFSPLREDIEKMEMASFITKAINSLVGFSHPDYHIFQLLLQSLLWVEEKIDFLIKPLFIFKLISLLGLFPSLSKCICCHKKIEDAVGLNLKDGGLTCNEHLDGSFPISQQAIKIINSLSKIPFLSGKRVSIAESLKDEIDEISQRILSFHVCVYEC
ncbi:MAG: DNA repair protein RecO [bacterium]